MNFPSIFAPMLRERGVCLGLLGVCVGLTVANMCGLSLWKCAFRETTGLPCPGCGLTRGMSALMRGHWHEAIGWHPFTPLFAIAGALMLIAGILPNQKRIAMTDVIGTLERRTGFVWFTLVALLVYGLWRMWRGPWI